jgi:CHAT domain
VRFRDPSGTAVLDLPAGWALDLLTSEATTLAFGTWAGGDRRRLMVRLSPTRKGVDGDEAWVEATRAHFVRKVDAVRMDTVRGPEQASPVVWAVVPGAEGSPDARCVTVRGSAIDVSLEEIGASRGGRMRTPLLESVLHSLWIPANTEIIHRAREPWDRLMAAADEAIGRSDHSRGADLCWQACVSAAMEWQLGLKLGSTNLHMLVAAADALLRYSAITGDIRALDDATVLLTRSSPLSEEQVDGESPLDRALRQTATRGDVPTPIDPGQAAFVRARLATREARDPASAEFAMDLAARCLVMADRVEEIGIDGPIGSSRTRTIAIRVLSDASMDANDVRDVVGIRIDPDASDTFLFAAREISRLAPDHKSRQNLVRALRHSAEDLRSIGDDASLRAAQDLLVEARDLLYGLPERVADMVWLSSAWVSQELGCSEEALAFADRIVAATSASAQVRSVASLALGRAEEALQLAVTADGTDGAFRAGLAAALLANGRRSEAVEQVRLEIMRELVVNVFSSRMQNLLAILGDALEPGSSLALRSTALAVDLLDYAPRWEAQVDRVAGYDEAPRRRRSAASLVLRLHESGDELGALAAADRARARTLAPGFLRTAPGDERTAVTSPPPATLTIAELLESLETLISAHLALIGVTRGASGQQLCEMVTASGRATLVLHPTTAGLVRILVRPHMPPHVDVRQAPDLGALGRRFAIAVAQRGARPAPSEAQILAALQAWGAEPEEAEHVDGASRQAYDEIFGGLDLAASEPLAVVPYRELALLPISTLTDETGNPVIVRHPLSTMPSIISTLGTSPTRRHSSLPPAVVLGDPDVDPAEDLPHLQGARAEAEQVADLLNGHLDVTLLLGAGATEAALREKARGARLLHLACHAAVNQESDRSALYLTRAGADDGRLEVKDAEDLMLDDALVVLAACETGLGRPTPDGVNGLGRAFARAGARCVLLSLWRVGDASTSSLMGELYQGLLGLAGRPLDVSEALAHAQLATRLHYPDVTQWGPWLIVGDGGWRLV